MCINRSTEVNSNVSRALVEASSSYIIVPLVVGSGIWGLLSLECTGRERYWQDLEIDLASNIATQLGVAIQQSLFFQELQTELKERKRAELALQKLNQELELRIEQRTAMLRISRKNSQINERRFRSFFDFAPIGIAVTDIKTDQLIAVNQSFCQLLG
ncbi:MAG: PAS domain-containing protein, partial [Pseudanabaena sp. SU_2_4]|nr:PAS domain-containing protein [Pseudanabaena sp. SU_2_4]